MNIVKLLKFKKKKCLDKDIAHIVTNFIIVNDIKADHVEYVPMFRAKERARGFNQSHLIAKSFPKRLM